MAKRTTAPKKAKGAVKAKGPRNGKAAKAAKTTRRAKTATASKTRTSGVRPSRAGTQGEMSTSVLEGPMKSLIADALMKRK